MRSERLQVVGLVVLQFLALILSYIVTLLVVSLIWVLFAGVQNYPDSFDAAQRQIQLIGGVAFILLVYRFYRRKGFSFPSAAGLVKTGLTKAEYALFAGFGAVMNLVFVMLLNLLPLSFVADYGVSVSDALTGGNLVINSITVLLFAPVMEELVFRGLCYGYLSACMKPYAAAAVLSVVFGLTHSQPVWVFYAMLMGMAFAAIRIRTGSVLPSITAHLAFNAVSLVIYLLASGFGAAWPFGAPLPVMWLLFAAVTAAAVFLTKQVYRMTSGGSSHG
jgi:membrane protease YdiL (CAAX protease family)